MARFLMPNLLILTIDYESFCNKKMRCTKQRTKKHCSVCRDANPIPYVSMPKRACIFIKYKNTHLRRQKQKYSFASQVKFIKNYYICQEQPLILNKERFVLQATKEAFQRPLSFKKIIEGKPGDTCDDDT